MTQSDVLEILKDWNLWGGNDMAEGTAKRNLTSELLGYEKSKEVIVLKGLRRCGKSTVLYQVMKEISLKIGQRNVLYVNLEDPRLVFERKNTDALEHIYNAYLSGVKPTGKHVLFLDEVQNVNGWEKWVRQARDRGIKIYVTGSSSGLLSGEIGSLLTGRNISIEAYPFRFSEIMDISGGVTLKTGKNRIISLFNEYLKFGGFPEVVLSPNERVKVKLLRQYFEDIIYRDIAGRNGLRDAEALKELGVYLMTNIAAEAGYNSISKAVGSDSVEKIRTYVNYMKSVYLIYEVRKFSFSVKKQLREPRKIYAPDNGIRNAVSFDFSPNSGRLLENAVFTELSARGSDIYYFREKKETDFIVKNGSAYEIINVCYDSSAPDTKQREYDSLCHTMEIFGAKKSLLITMEEEREEKYKGRKISVVPAWKWMLGLKEK